QQAGHDVLHDPVEEPQLAGALEDLGEGRAVEGRAVGGDHQAGDHHDDRQPHLPGQRAQPRADAESHAPRSSRMIGCHHSSLRCAATTMALMSRPRMPAVIAYAKTSGRLKACSMCDSSSPSPGAPPMYSALMVISRAMVADRRRPVKTNSDTLGAHR